MIHRRPGGQRRPAAAAVPAGLVKAAAATATEPLAPARRARRPRHRGPRAAAAAAVPAGLLEAAAATAAEPLAPAPTWPPVCVLGCQAT